MKKRRLRIVITAGPTREYLDAIRFISNPSSGKMGYAIAAAAAWRGHSVTLISGPVALTAADGVNVIRVESGGEMADEARRAFVNADGAIFAAAVCDYRPARRASRKLPKQTQGMTIDLVATKDIAASLGRRKGRRVTIAFALEDRDGRRKAERKLQAKNADAILLNAPGNLESNRAEFELLQRGGEWQRWPAAAKTIAARRIVELIERLCDEKRPGRNAG